MAVTVRTLQNFVGGAWVDSTGDSIRPIVSPVTGETLAEVPDASAEDIDRAVAAARAAQPKWAALSAWGRANICHAIADLIDERREEFARELSLEQGKPDAAEALGDIGNVVVNDSTDYREAHEPFGGASGTQSGWGRIGVATRCST
jgi:acyl-CoA reductase-like NAD-dependent aldehyde dehydrogenase